MTEDTVGIIDLGSNSARLSIFRKDHKEAVIRLEETKEMVRLGEKMGPEKVLTPAAISRAIQALHYFLHIAKSYHVQRIIPVATAAVRLATNQQAFLEEVAQETGLDFRVLGGDEEAYYDYLGILHTFDIPNAYIVDVGGASTEIIRMEGRKMTHSISIPLGSVTITESFIDADPPTAKSLSAMNLYLRTIIESLDWLQYSDRFPLIILGGTARNIGKMNMKKIMPSFYNLRLLHYHELSRDTLKQLYQTLCQFTQSKRKNIPGLNKNRSDIIIGGSSIIVQLAEILHTPSIFVRGAGLREGLLVEYLSKNHPNHHKIMPDNVLESSTNNLLLQYDPNPQGMLQAAHLSQSLFQQTKSLHRLDEEWKNILYHAVKLHRIGKYVDHYHTNEHSFYLLMQSPIYGLPLRKRILIAFLCQQYYGKKWNQERAEPFFSYFQSHDPEHIQRLGLLLRMSVQAVEESGHLLKSLPIHLNHHESTLVLPKDTIRTCTLQKWQKDWEKLFGSPLAIAYACDLSPSY